jgi:transposase
MAHPVPCLSWPKPSVKRSSTTLPEAAPPPEFSAEQVCEIVALACREPEEFGIPISQWSHCDLAAAAVELDIVESISPSHLGRLLREMDVKPHRSKYWLHPEIEDEEEFSRACAEISNLYLQAPQLAAHGTHVISVDEKTGIQALDRTQPILPMRPGQVERRTHDYKRNGIVDLFAALNLATGEVVHHIRPQHRAIEFRKFLDGIDAAVPDDLDVHVVLDNSSTHKTPEINKWLLRHPRVTLHFTPTSSSWLNLVERWFAELTNRLLRRSAHRTIKALTDDLNTWIATWNDNPRPFVWHKTADDILNGLKKYLTNL